MQWYALIQDRKRTSFPSSHLIIYVMASVHQSVLFALLWRTLIVSYIRSHHTSSKDIRHILVMIISITSMALSTDLTTRLSIESVKLMNSIPYSYTPMSVEDTTAQSIPHQTTSNTLDAQHPLIQSIDKNDKTVQHNTALPIHSFQSSDLLRQKAI
eukprot:204357_1